VADADRGDRLRDYEIQVDAAFNALTLPGASWSEAAWCLLTVCDDMQRFGLLGVSMKSPEEFAKVGQAVAFQLSDEHKYAIRHALLSARALPEGKHAWGRKLDDAEHGIAFCTIRGARDYGRVCGIFAACYEKATAYSCREPNTLVIDTDAEALRYVMMEALLSVFEKARTSFLSVFFAWSIAGGAPPVILDMARGARSKQGVVEYARRLDAICAIADLAKNDESLVPAAWRFPWGGSAEDTLSVLRTLHAMALIHACVVHKAQLGVVEDNGAAALCLALGKKELLRYLVQGSGVSPNVVGRLAEALTYGHRMNVPDPILQPIVPLDAGAVAIAPLTTMGSDLQRNILSLHARYDKASFDAQSGLFEERMVQQVSLAVSQSRFSRAENLTFGVGRRREEIDVVVVDAKEKFIALLELRWMLPPGDPREVMHRLRVGSEKVEQVHRKVAFGKEHTRLLLHALGRADDGSDWQVAGAVVLDGFVGRESEDRRDLPVVPLEIVRRSIRLFTSLRQWHAWLRAKDWLPTADRDFVVEPWELNVGPIKIEGQHARLAREASYFSSDLVVSMKPYIDAPRADQTDPRCPPRS